jgi:dTDP-4-amino-4,6-dideoxygalactose transaminase
MADDYIVFGSPSIGPEEIEAVEQTLRSCWIGTGPRVQEFERAFASYVGARNAVAVNSCTAALHLSLLAAGIGPGDEVITPALTFAATANVVVHTGATPVLVDVGRDTMNVDPEAVARALTPRTRCVIPVHFAGRPCDMDSIAAIARRHGLIVVEDAAHAIEAEYHGRKVGTISPMTCFSFYVTKNLTTAEGGMICTEDDDLARELRIWALHGLSADAWKRFSDSGYRHYEVVHPGFKYNMTDIQAALGLCQLRRLGAWQRRRQEIWTRYDEAFAGLPVARPAPAEPQTVHARHLYTLLVDEAEAGIGRDAFMARLHARGIGTGVHYRALHLHRYYRERFGFRPEDFPEAHRIGERTVSLPLSAKLTDADVDRVIGAVRGVLPQAVRATRVAT